jgi:uncharacterized protein
MNEQENTRLVQQAYQSLKAGDLQSFLNSYAEDVEWQVPETGNVPFAGKHKGREQLRQFLSELFQAQDMIELEPQEFIAQGDKLVVLGNFSGRDKVTGREFDFEWVHVYTFRGGKIISFHEYIDTAAPPS